MSQLIIFPRGQLSDLDKARMEEAGIVAVEADDPAKVVQLMPFSSLITGDDMLMSMMEGATTYQDTGSRALRALHNRLKKREEATGSQQS